MTKRSAPPLVRFFQFFGRVQFTMLLLLLGAVVMIAGTLVESQSGTAAAQSGIYRTAWFQLYLILIGVNLLVSVINRIPIQRHQWAFVLTHLSIVLLLVGAWIGHAFGHEGQLGILEGTEERALVTEDAELRVEWPASAPTTAPLARFADPTGLVVFAPTDSQARVSVDRHVARGVLETRLVEGDGGPGVSVHLDGMGLHHTELLIGESRTHRRKDLGPVDLEVLVARSPEFLARRLPEARGATTTVELRFADAEQPVTLSLPGDLGRDVEIAPGVQAQVTRYLRRARVQAGELGDSPDAPVNPAAIVRLRSEGLEETHTVFSEFPQFNLIERSDAERPLPVELRLHASTTADKPLISLLVDPGADQLYVQLSAGEDRGPAHAFQPGKTVAIGNLGIDLQVLEYLPHAKAEPAVRPVSDPEAQAWLHFVAARGEESADAWLSFGSSRSVVLGGQELLVTWRRARIELPFAVALDEFEIDFHPGSNRPSQYRSHVRIRDEDGTETKAAISMNRPLDHRGYRMFQSSYRLRADGRRDATFLSVSHDPGVTVVYLAFVLMVIGVGWYLIGHGRRRQTVAPDERPGPDAALEPPAREPAERVVGSAP